MRRTPPACSATGAEHGARVGRSNGAGLQRNASASGLDWGIAAVGGRHNVAAATVAIVVDDETADCPPCSDRVGRLRSWSPRGHDGSLAARRTAGAHSGAR